MDATVDDPSAGSQGAQEQYGHPPILVNETPSLINTGVAFIQQYGWFLLLGAILCLFIKAKLTPYLDKWRRKVEEHKQARNYDPDKAHAKIEAMEASRRRMQEKFDAQTSRHAEQMKIKEEEKRQQKIDDWEGHQHGKGYRSKYKPKEQEEAAKPGIKPKRTPLKPTEYSPLAGDGGASCDWRPRQRGGGGGSG